VFSKDPNDQETANIFFGKIEQLSTVADKLYYYNNIINNYSGIKFDSRTTKKMSEAFESFHDRLPFTMMDKMLLTYKNINPKSKSISMLQKEVEKTLYEYKNEKCLAKIKYTTSVNLTYGTGTVPDKKTIKFKEKFNLFGANEVEAYIDTEKGFDYIKSYTMVVKIKNTSKVKHYFNISSYGQVDKLKVGSGGNKLGRGLAKLFTVVANSYSENFDGFERDSETISLKPYQTKYIILSGKCEGLKRAYVKVTPQGCK
jgi:hypothetical protein